MSNRRRTVSFYLSESSIAILRGLATRSMRSRNEVLERLIAQAAGQAIPPPPRRGPRPRPHLTLDQVLGVLPAGQWVQRSTVAPIVQSRLGVNATCADYWVGQVLYPYVSAYYRRPGVIMQDFGILSLRENDGNLQIQRNESGADGNHISVKD